MSAGRGCDGKKMKKNEKNEKNARVEANQVRLEHRPQHLLPHGQRPVNLGRRKGRVQEPAHLHVRHGGLQQGGQEHQVVILDPHDIPRAVERQDRVRKRPVGGLVGGPLDLQGARLGQLGLHVQGHVVEELPEDGVAEAVVVEVDGAGVKVDGRVRLGRQGGGQGVPVRAGRGVHAGPAHPDGGEGLDGDQGGDQAAGGDLEGRERGGGRVRVGARGTRALSPRSGDRKSVV